MLKLYSVYDKKAETWSNPWAGASRGAVIRSFVDLLQDKNHPVAKHPDDFVLWEVGLWDEVKGHLPKVESQVELGSATDLAGSAQRI